MKSKALTILPLLCLALISLSVVNVPADVWSVELSYDPIVHNVSTLFLNASGFLCEKEALVIVFHSYSCQPLVNITVFTGPVELYSKNVTNPVGSVEIAVLYKLEKSGELTGLDVFIMDRSSLMERIAVLDEAWILGYPRQPILLEIIQIDGQWPYAPA